MYIVLNMNPPVYVIPNENTKAMYTVRCLFTRMQQGNLYGMRGIWRHDVTPIAEITGRILIYDWLYCATVLAPPTINSLWPNGTIWRRG